MVLPISIEKIGEEAFSNCPSVVVMVPTMDMAEAEELFDKVGEAIKKLA